MMSMGAFAALMAMSPGRYSSESGRPVTSTFISGCSSKKPASRSGKLPEAVPEPPPLPERMQSGESIEPDVTIVRGERETVMEYRINGQLRAVKVIPDVGAPYYLVDANGDGTLESRHQGIGGNFLINQWVIFSW